MKLVKCKNGHFYDEERYDSCPHCSGTLNQGDNLTVPVMRAAANDAVTVAMDTAPARETVPATPVQEVARNSNSLKDAVTAASIGEVEISGDKTVGFFSHTIGMEPVVGWLVCITGEHFGEDFKLKSGRNFIGRASNMDVSITRDTTVSRERHAVLVYEPRGNVFIVQPGDSKELCYLNDEVVLAPKEIKVNDKLLVGKTQLMFIPCCSKEFNWDMVKKED